MRTRRGHKTGDEKDGKERIGKEKRNWSVRVECPLWVFATANNWELVLKLCTAADSKRRNVLWRGTSPEYRKIMKRIQARRG